MDKRLVKQWPNDNKPSSKKDVQAFVTIMAKYRHNIPDYYQIMRPLIELAYSNTVFHWNIEHDFAYQRVFKLLWLSAQ